MDCYILGCVLPLNGTIYFRKDYKILGLNINERKNREFVMKRTKGYPRGRYFEPATKVRQLERGCKTTRIFKMKETVTTIPEEKIYICDMDLIFKFAFNEFVNT